jgi:hypothetical protein
MKTHRLIYSSCMCAVHDYKKRNKLQEMNEKSEKLTEIIYTALCGQSSVSRILMNLTLSGVPLTVIKFIDFCSHG